MESKQLNQEIEDLTSDPVDRLLQEKKPASPATAIAILALLVAMGVLLHRVEAVLPLPSPWIKLGLSNIMTLVALVFLGFRDALTVTVLRVILGSVLAGTFLSRMLS